MAFVSDGSYGVPQGLVYGYPVTVKNGQDVGVGEVLGMLFV